MEENALIVEGTRNDVQTFIEAYRELSLRNKIARIRILDEDEKSVKIKIIHLNS